MVYIRGLIGLLLVAGYPGSLWAEATITEWQVPWENSRPRDPYVADADARTVWFVGQRSDYLAHLNTTTGVFAKVALADGAGPHNLIVGNDGTVWYAGNRQAHIGRYRADGGKIHTIPMPNGHPKDPHTLVFDRSGHIWFTAQGANTVGRLNTTTEALDIIAVPTPRARPYGIVVDASDQPWIALFGTNKLARVHADTLALEEIELPRNEARPRRLVVGNDAAIWYVDYAQGYLGRLDPVTGAIREWRSPGGEDARPYAMEVDKKGDIWYVETGSQPNRLVSFSVREERFEESVVVPSGGGTVRHMVFHSPTNTLWFGTDTNTIGRVTLE